MFLLAAAQPDYCGGFVLLGILVAWLAYDHHMKVNHPQVYFEQQRLEEEKKARRHRNAMGAAGFFLRMFLGGK
jgi:hypothetical protein